MSGRAFIELGGKIFLLAAKYKCGAELERKMKDDEHACKTIPETVETTESETGKSEAGAEVPPH